MDIEKLLQQPESKTLEFKRDLSSLGPILKTVVAFANTAGGTLIIGREGDGSLREVKDVFAAEEKLANAIAENIKPGILPEIEIATVDGKNLLVLKVAHWKGPFFLKKQGIPGGVYVRLGSTSRPAGPELLEEMKRAALNTSFDVEPLSDLDVAAIDEKSAQSLFESVGKKVDRRKLKTLGILTSSANRTVPTIGGLILFGHEEERNRLFPDARVRCARFAGTDKSEIIDRIDIEGTVLDAVEEVPKFIRRNTRMGAEIKGMVRKDIPEYEPVAVREALVNALVHADYSLSGSCIQIAIFDDRLEIQNPGMLPFGFTIEDFKAGISRARNRVISRVFRELNLMEKWGSGYKRIVEACRAGGYPDPQWFELGSAIRVEFYPYTGRAANQSYPLTDRQRSILSQFQEDKPLSFRQLFKKIEPPIGERTLRYELAQLREIGVLVVEGKGASTVYRQLHGR